MLKQVFGGVLEGFWAEGAQSAVGFDVENGFGGVLEGFRAEGAQSAVGFMLKTVLVGFQRGFGRWAHKGASKARFVSEF